MPPQSDNNKLTAQNTKIIKDQENLVAKNHSEIAACHRFCCKQNLKNSP